MKPHVHAEMYHAFADGSTIQVEDEGWHDCLPPFLAQFKYRVKPAAPGYPETTMTPNELIKVFFGEPGSVTDAGSQRYAFVAVANAALRHAIDAGQVAPAEAYDQCRADLLAAEKRNAERDLAIARNVLESCRIVCSRYMAAQQALDAVNLQACIASVK